MRLAVTGRDGQVARSLEALAAGRDDLDVTFLARPDFDLSDPTSIRRAVTALDVDLLVSAAAYTAVDRAEDEPETAHAVNATGPGILAEAAAERDIPLVHLSTDYVYSGAMDRPYRESDATGPVSAYGRTKLAGEEAIAAASNRHVILRTAWVYSPFGVNFVKTMLRLAAGRDEISVVSDQWGNPTAAADIAEAIVVAGKAIIDQPAISTGAFHFAGTGETSWSGFAAEIMRLSAKMDGPTATIRPIPTSAYPTRAARPANSRLDTRKFEAAFAWKAPNWQASLEGSVAAILKS